MVLGNQVKVKETFSKTLHRARDVVLKYDIKHNLVYLNITQP